jgi:Phospholipase_D-nuclease N-terminal
VSRTTYPQGVTRALSLLIVLGFMVFCLVDCFQTPEERIRNLPKVIWVLLIIIIPIVGGVAWLVAGRASIRPSGPGRPPGGRPVAPDDDDDFLRGLG